MYRRSSSLDKYSEKNFVLRQLPKKIYVVNYGHITQPFTPDKRYQQAVIKKAPGINSKKTYSFLVKEELMQSIKKRELTFSFIRKPSIGAKGRDVCLIKSEKQIIRSKVNNYIFQNYIENDDDYRVFVVGGEPIGVIKRIAKEGGFLNNYSQGGLVELIKDQRIVKELFKLAMKISSVFELSICGLDFIYD